MMASEELAPADRWVVVGHLDELSEGAVHRLVVGSVRLAVVRDGDRVHAVGDRCTHLGVSLSRGGPATGCLLTCWLHGSRFDLRTGVPREPPATSALPVHTVRIEPDERGASVVVVDLEPIVAKFLTSGS
jgi:3-phenylpropionate/trans-cinnamate dioxygenase ferredoxin subunit